MDDSKQRLQKVLAAAGFGSRRNCEELIVEGRVEVDREIVTELGTRVDLQEQLVRVDGVVVKAPRMRYFVVNKPVGVLSTARDPWARLRVIDLVESEERLFTVGRLDKASSGLILVTNDGQLANELAHPRFGVTKTYEATVIGKPNVETLAKIRKGIHLAEAVARVVTVKVKKAHSSKSILEIVLAEGRNREIRRMLAQVGHKVVQLKRTALGPVRLGELPKGAYRELTREEIRKLKLGNQPAASNSENTPRKSKPRSATRPTKKISPKASSKASPKAAAMSYVTTSKPERFVGAVLGGEEPKPRKEKKSPRTATRKTVTQKNSARKGSAAGNRRIKTAAKRKKR